MASPKEEQSRDRPIAVSIAILDTILHHFSLSRSDLSKIVFDISSIRLEMICVVSKQHEKRERERESRYIETVKRRKR